MMPIDETGETVNGSQIRKGLKTAISGDFYEAYAVVDEPGLSPTEIQAALEAEGIVYGIDNNAVMKAIESVGERTLVASGSRHTDGTDGYFESAVAKPDSECEKRFGLVNVMAGDTLGTIHKPSPGSVGIDVFGRKVQPKEGRDLKMFTSANIKRVDTENGIVLEAAEDGYFRVDGASIEIIAEYTLRSDIDYSDGELEFAGSLRIAGDLKGGVSLTVRHDVYVDGSVEDARIVSGGNVKVKDSFVGRGDGLIRAGGNVEVNVVLNQRIEAGGSVSVGKESVNAHLAAFDSVVARKAVIMGGIIVAGEKIEVLTLGGELYSTTKVRLGLTEILRENMAALDKEIELQVKAINQLKNEIYVLVRERIDNNSFTKEKSERLKRLQDRLRHLDTVIKELNAKKQDKIVELNRKRSPKLTVLDIIHQSVAAEINGVRLPLKQSYRNVTFEELKNEIIRTKNL